VFLAAIENAVRPLTQPELLFMGVLLFGALLMYGRYFQRLAIHGPQTRPDLLGIPEMLAGSLIMGLFVITVVARSFSPQTPPPNLPLDRLLLDNMANMALPAAAIIVLLLARGGSLGSVYGIRKVGLFRAIGIGFFLAVLALPLTYGAKAITVWLTASQEAPQALVQKFNSAVTGGDTRLVGLIALSACVIAPITEELLFRGTFYPMLARGLGRGPAALACAVFFGLVHDTFSDVPGLTVLALCFTLAYELTGSLLVPMFMHATFNGLSLLVMWWQVRAGVGP
jgi:membrane protease YdiL (CAAX protease family)